MTRLLLLIATLALCLPASAQPTADSGPQAHTTAPAVNPGPGGAPDQPFDDAAALKYSQEAIGRILDGHTLPARAGRYRGPIPGASPWSSV